MFNADFYPTPEDVVHQMILGLDLKDKFVLEPSAGSGNILKILKQYGAKTLACESNKDLAEITKTKCDKFLKNDFIKVEPVEISHINYIIANPPFSNAVTHIQHMWEVCPDGCEIITLANAESIKNDYSYSRKSLKQLIQDHGSYINLGNCFSESERKTDVEIVLIKLFKPKLESEFEFEGYFDLAEDYEQQSNGIMQYNEVRDIVNRYVGAVKMYNSVMDSSKEINDLMSPINNNHPIIFGSFQKDSRGDFVSISRDTFKKELQKNAWKTIFARLNMQKYVTQSVMSDINKFVEQQINVPFTMNNVYKMIEMVIGTRGDRMNRVLVEAFEKICSYARENSTAGNERDSWKTNSNYKVNKNFIKPYITEVDWNGEFKIRYNSSDELDDINKALCFLTGNKFEDLLSIQQFFGYRYKLKVGKKYLNSYHNFSNKFEEIEKRQKDLLEVGTITEIEDSGVFEFGKWYEWGFFMFKGFKKGTGHFKFIDDNVWYQFNKQVSEIKGWRLPSKTDDKTTGKERTKKTELEIY